MPASGDFYGAPGPAPGAFLGRYRRPVGEAMAESYVVAWTKPGDVVLDPFCQDAAVLRAATSTGRRAVGVTSNPLLALLARVEAQPPPAQDLEAALRRIREAPKVDTPLGEHLDGLYATACSRCGERVAAAAFIWDRGAAQPVLRDYRCPHCGHAARDAVPAAETASHLAFDAQGFHRRLVAERLRTDGGHRRLQERLIDLYTPRGTYALTALLLKIELLFAASPLLDPLRAALLQTLDAASKLHQATEEGWRPVHSLQPPRQYREANVWQTFVAAVQAMAAWPRPDLRLASALEQALAAPGSAYLGLDPLPRLAGPLVGQVKLALAQLPRFDPTFAALSYLWGGWLLGKEGSRMAEHLLSQRLSGESGYLRALHSALALLSTALALEGHLVFVFQAPATRYLEALLVAAGRSGLLLAEAWHGLLDDRPAPQFGVRRAEHHLLFERRAAPPVRPGDAAPVVHALAVRTVRAVLAERGEPAPYSALHGPIWDALAQEGLLGGSTGMEEAEGQRRALGAAVQEGLGAALGRDLTVSMAGGNEGVTWWLAAPPTDVVPLSDRVEVFAREALQRGGAIDEISLAREIGERFPGTGAPSQPLVEACLAAYGTPLGGGRWAAGEEPEGQREAALGVLTELGHQLGYEVSRGPAQPRLLAERAETCDLQWLEAGRAAWVFLWRGDASSTDLRAMAPPSAGRRVLVIPERRVALWRHKLQAAPQWAAELERAGWAFLREEALARLSSAMDRQYVASVLGLEGGDAGAQLALFTSGA